MERRDEAYALSLSKFWNAHTNGFTFFPFFSNDFTPLLQFLFTG